LCSQVAAPDCGICTDRNLDNVCQTIERLSLSFEYHSLLVLLELCAINNLMHVATPAVFSVHESIQCLIAVQCWGNIFFVLNPFSVLCRLLGSCLPFPYKSIVRMPARLLINVWLSTYDLSNVRNISKVTYPLQESNYESPCERILDSSPPSNRRLRPCGVCHMSPPDSSQTCDDATCSCRRSLLDCPLSLAA